MRTMINMFTLITFTFLISCHSQSMPTPVLPVTTPSITGLSAVPIYPLTTGAIRQYIGPFMGSNPYSEIEGSNQLLLYLVSSGEFDQAEITLSSGKTYQADVLYGFALMSNQRVLAAPVLVGLTLQDDHYAYFSEKYSFDDCGGVTTTSVDRQTALADAQARLPRGRIFRLLAYGMATQQGLDWIKCPSIPFYPLEICQIGELVEELYPHQTKAFMLRLADEFPANWFLAGWVFQEFDPSEFVPGTKIDIPLPSPSQP